MDFIHKFTIELDKDIYYAGEVVTGRVAVLTTENIKVKGIRLTLRGKAHTEWKINRAGETRTVKDDEYYIDDKKVIWGKDKHEEGDTLILPRGQHMYPFEFKLPETALPCSFESKIGHIRYYLRVIMDTPYASPPQGIKYFTIVGPHIDCMEEKYLAPEHGKERKRSCCFCFLHAPIEIQATLERSAYCCGEHIRVTTDLYNGSDENVHLLCKFLQFVDYYNNKGVLAIMKTVSHVVWQYRSNTVKARGREKLDGLQDNLLVPVMPPTLLEACGLLQIYYVLKLYVVGETSGDMINIQFPITIATLPFRIPNHTQPQMLYEVAVNYVEGGKYISSEFQLGQVYTGDDDNDHPEEVLYRPMYCCVPHERKSVANSDNDDNESTYYSIEKHKHKQSETDVVKVKPKSLDRRESAGNSSRLRPGVIPVEEVSSQGPWEIIALKK